MEDAAGAIDTTGEKYREEADRSRTEHKGDSAAALILVTARWWIFRGKGTNGTRIDCVTTGAWERDAESAIRDRAQHS